MPVRDSMDDFMAGSSKAGPVDEFCCCRRCGLCSGASDWTLFPASRVDWSRKLASTS